MNARKGCLYGVGVGPGDPEEMTLKAVRVIRTADVIIYPGETAKDSLAWQIAAAAVPEISEKEQLGIPVPMTKDTAVLREKTRDNADRIEAYLQQGKTAACLTLGDPTIYSSFSYLRAIIQEDGYPTGTVSGVPSFCAAAARLNIPLVQWDEQLHIIPAAHSGSDLPSCPGTNVYMKTGRKLKEVRDSLAGKASELYMVANCGLENEVVCRSAEEIPDSSGYLATVIAIDRRSGQAVL